MKSVAEGSAALLSAVLLAGCVHSQEPVISPGQCKAELVVIDAGEQFGHGQRLIGNISDGPSNYDPWFWCEWRITVPSGRIRLTFLEFDMRDNAGVAVYDAPNGSASHIEHCPTFPAGTGTEKAFDPRCRQFQGNYPCPAYICPPDPNAATAPGFKASMFQGGFGKGWSFGGWSNDTKRELVTTGPHAFIRAGAMDDRPGKSKGFVLQWENLPDPPPVCTGCADKGGLCQDDRECPLGTSCERVYGFEWHNFKRDPCPGCVTNHRYGSVNAAEKAQLPGEMRVSARADAVNAPLDLRQHSYSPGAYRSWVTRNTAEGIKICQPSMHGADCTLNPFLCTQGLDCVGGTCTYPRHPGDGCNDTRACSVGTCNNATWLCEDLTNVTGGLPLSDQLNGQCAGNELCQHFSMHVECRLAPLVPGSGLSRAVNTTCEVLPRAGELCYNQSCAITPGIGGPPLSCRDGNTSQSHKTVSIRSWSAATGATYQHVRPTTNLPINISQYRCYEPLSLGLDDDMAMEIVAPIHSEDLAQLPRCAFHHRTGWSLDGNVTKRTGAADERTGLGTNGCLDTGSAKIATSKFSSLSVPALVALRTRAQKVACHTHHREACEGGPNALVATGSGAEVVMGGDGGGGGPGGCVPTTDQMSSVTGTPVYISGSDESNGYSAQPNGQCVGFRSVPDYQPAVAAEQCASGHLWRKEWNGTAVVDRQQPVCAPAPTFHDGQGDFGEPTLKRVRASPGTLQIHNSYYGGTRSNTLALPRSLPGSCNDPLDGTVNASNAGKKMLKDTRFLFRSCPRTCNSVQDCVATGYDTADFECSCVMGEAQPTCKDRRNVNSFGRSFCAGCCPKELRALNRCIRATGVPLEASRWVRRMVENQLTHPYNPQVRAARCIPHAVSAVTCIIEKSPEYFQCGANRTLLPTGGQPNCTRNTSFVWRGFGSEAYVEAVGCKSVLANSFYSFAQNHDIAGPSALSVYNDTFGLREMYLNWPPIPPPPRFSELEKALMIAGSALFVIMCYVYFTLHPKTQTLPAFWLPHKLREWSKSNKHHMHLYEAPSDLEKLRMELCGIVNESDFEPVRELLLQCEREFAHDKRVKDPVVLDLLARGQKKQEKAERKRWLDKKIEERRGRDSLPDPVPEPEPEPESQMGAELESEVAPEGDPTQRSAWPPNLGAQLRSRPRSRGADAKGRVSHRLTSASVAPVRPVSQEQKPVSNLAVDWDRPGIPRHLQEQAMQQNSSHRTGGDEEGNGSGGAPGFPLARLDELLGAVKALRTQSERKIGESETAHRMSVLDTKLNAVLKLMEQLRVTVISSQDDPATAEVDAEGDVVNERSFPQEHTVILYK